MLENTDLIKQKIGVKEFVGSYVSLKPAGRNLKGLCPFHKEKSPSFMVNPERQIWKCFGCGKGGDIFAFLMQYENLEFIEALKVLADRAGVELKQLGTSDQKKYEQFYEILRIAKDYYKSSLLEPAGSPALNYLTDRGLKKETIEEFELGVALPGNDNLMRHLVKLGYHPDQIKQVGLINKNDRGLYYDFFRSRIMFPLHNHFGKVVGFTGRVMPGNDNPDIGKYVNSPESPVFNKSKLLFGFWKTKNEIRSQNQAVLVEGQMDFLMAYQDGVKQVIATSGTAITQDHLGLIRRISENLVLSFDNDPAGRAAAERTIDLAAQNDLNVRVIMVGDPTLKDPADIVKTHPGEFEKLVRAAIPAMEYYFFSSGIDRLSDVAARKKSIRFILEKIKQIQSPVEQQQWSSLLSRRANIPEVVLSAEMQQLKSLGGKSAENAATLDSAKRGESYIELPINRIERVVRRILSIALSDKAVLKRALAARTLFPEIYQKPLEYVGQAGEGITIGDSAMPTELVSLINLIYLESGFEPAPGEIEALFEELERYARSGRKKELQTAIRQAEAVNDQVLLARLLDEYRSI